jgi:lipopolysaccharide export system permease protein
MARLSRYLLRLFSAEAVALFAIAAFLLFLIQCLRLFDVVSVRGQGLLTLLGQALLGMPSLGLIFLFVCVGIGLGRALRNLQGTQELQIIHASALLPALLRAIGLYALASMLLALLLTHVVEPLSLRASNEWSANIAAELVSSSMIPHRFTEVASGVSMVIGARDRDGEITDFFADDNRNPASRRTYFAKSAVIVRDEQGFVLRMRDGALQQKTSAGYFSQISFGSFDLELSQLAGEVSPAGGGLAQTSSVEMFGALLAGTAGAEEVRALVRRSAEGLRVLAMCLLVAGVAAFPTGARRRFEVPVELVVLGAAFIERAVGSYMPGPKPLDLVGGPLVLGVLGAAILAARLRVFRPVARRRAAA